MNNVLKILVLLLIFLFQASNAKNPQIQDKKIIKDASEISIVNQISGVYKERFRNGYIDGTCSIAENILEIVKINESTVYFRTYLVFFNGHICEMYGIAEYKGDNLFLYEDKEYSKCKLAIFVTDTDIVFFDGYENGPQCRESSCGFRGGYDGISFKKSKRRPIKYLNMLKNSIEYKGSVQQLSI